MNEPANEATNRESAEEHLEELFDRVNQGLEELVRKQYEFDRLNRRLGELSDRQRALERRLQGSNRLPAGAPAGPFGHGPGGQRPVGYPPFRGRPIRRGPFGAQEGVQPGVRFQPSAAAAARANGTVPVDVLDRRDEFVIHADLAGFERKEVVLECTDGIVHVRATRDEPDDVVEEDGGERYVHRERRPSVARSVPLPGTIDEAAITASMHNGVLTVRLPKTNEGEPDRRIEIE